MLGKRRKTTFEHLFVVLRWLARDFIKVTVQTGMGYKRNASSRLAIFVPEIRQKDCQHNYSYLSVVNF